MVSFKSDCCLTNAPAVLYRSQPPHCSPLARSVHCRLMHHAKSAAILAIDGLIFVCEILALFQSPRVRLGWRVRLRTGRLKIGTRNEGRQSSGIIRSCPMRFTICWFRGGCGFRLFHF
jgi:hypothetical protein